MRVYPLDISRRPSTSLRNQKKFYVAFLLLMYQTFLCYLLYPGEFPTCFEKKNVVFFQFETKEWKYKKCRRQKHEKLSNWFFVKAIVLRHYFSSKKIFNCSQYQGLQADANCYCFLRGVMYHLNVSYITRRKSYVTFYLKSKVRLLISHGESSARINFITPISSTFPGMVNWWISLDSYLIISGPYRVKYRNESSQSWSNYS